MPLQIRRGTDAERLAMTQPLAQGELLFVTNTERLYIGNGALLGGVAVTGYTDNDAKDAAATSFTTGSHSGINFSYNTATNIITATVDLSDYNGVINASSFNGTLVADDSTLLVDAIDGKINLDGTVKGNVIPDVNEAYDIGSASNRFRDLYLSGSSIELGAATITAVGTAVNLPSGSTINGAPIGVPGGDLNVNIVANDSTVIVNTTTEVVTAQGGFIGNIQGNVTGNVLGTVTGNITGNIFTNLIDSADSSTIRVTPPTIFDSDVTIENELFVDTLIQNGRQLTDIGGELFTTPQADEILVHYLTFVDSLGGRGTVKVDGDLRYTPNTEELAVGKLIVSTTTNCPTISTTNIFTSNVQSLGTLLLFSNLTTTNNARLVTVGDGTVDGRFQVSNSTTSAGQAIVTIGQSHSTVDASNFQFNRSRGSIASPTAVQSGDDVADIAFAGYDGTNYQVRASISGVVAGAVSAGVVPTQIVLATSIAGSGAPVTAVTINANQQTTFNGAITLAIYADDAARNTAIPSPTAGMVIFNTTGTKFQGYTGAAWVDFN